MPMFEALSDRLQAVFDKVVRRGVLTEADVDAALREVRLALLEADVNYKVVKSFIARVRERAVGEQALRSLTPAQQVITIVYEELVRTLGEPGRLDLSGPPPHVLMLVGLQGSGKTTTAAKLAVKLRKEGHRPLLVAADTYRPAAVEQLEILGKQVQIPVYSEGTEPPPPDICERGVKLAQKQGYTVVIMDTAGRLHIDDAMMAELEAIRDRTHPKETLLVVDAMTGQDAVRVADEFNKRIGLTGIILTKVDGDARGGAAISVREVTGVPIKFLGVGEKLDALEPFYPDRLASRILGMGDIQTLLEKAEQELDRQKALEAEKRLLEGTFTLEDFLEQLRELRKLGPITQILEMIPGMAPLARQLPVDLTERQLKRIEGIICSMTPEERRHPEIINASRKRRIARGSGTTVEEVNQLLRQFRQMQQLMKQLRKGRFPGNLMRGFGGFRWP